jgi:hypothetical protein
MRRASAGAALLAVVAACAAGGPGTVAGDVFVVLDDGAERNVGGAPVRLIADEARTDTALAELCGRRRDALALAGSDDAEMRTRVTEEAWSARERLLERRAAASARTGGDARFVVRDVPPGRYRVWTDALVQDERWSWMEAVTVGGGDSVHVSLGNHNADGDPFRCQLLLRIEADAGG